MHPLKDSIGKAKGFIIKSAGLQPLLRTREKIAGEDINRILQNKLSEELEDYPLKSSRTAYGLWLTLGFLGVHRFYLNKPLTALLMMFTGGGATVWWIIDGLHLAGKVKTYNQEQQQRRAEGRPPVGLDFISDRTIDIQASSPPWLQTLSTTSQHLAFVLDLLVLGIFCFVLASVATRETLFEPMLSGTVMAAMFLGGDRLLPYFHLPYIHELIYVDYKLRHFYFFNRPGNALMLLLRPVTGIVMAPFSKLAKMEVRLYVELGSTLAIPYILIEIIQWAAGGFVLSLDDLAQRLFLLYFLIYAFTCPLGAIFIKQRLTGVGERKRAVTGYCALLFIGLGLLWALT